MWAAHTTLQRTVTAGRQLLPVPVCTHASHSSPKGLFVVRCIAEGARHLAGMLPVVHAVVLASLADDVWQI